MTDDDRDELLRRVAKDVAEIKAALAQGAGAAALALGFKPASGGAGGGGRAGAVASDGELDSQYGDPEVKGNPRRWTGESYVGSRFSHCSAEFLDCLAEFKEWQASKDDESGTKDTRGRPKSQWAWKDARLARGWAARIRAGWKPKRANGVNGGRDFSDDDYGGGFDDTDNFSR